MSRQKKDRDLFPNGAISEEAMFAYLQDGLSPAEKQQFEKLLADDPFAREALDGLQAAQLPVVTKSMASVKRQVREMSGATEPKLIKMHWTNYAWAAAVFGVLVGIGFLMVGYLGNKNENLAQNTEKVMDTETNLLEGKPEGPQFENAAPVTDSLATQLIATEEATDMPAVNEPVKEAENQSFFAKKPEGVSTGADAGPKNDKAAPAVVNPPVTADKKALMASEPAAGTVNRSEDKNRESVKQEQKVSEDGALESVTVSSKKAEKQKPKGKSTAVTISDMNTASGNKAPDIETAMKNFNDGNYDVSSEQFSTVLKSDPQNADALYFGGISDYITNKNAKGEKNFDKLLKSGNRYTEGSKWYKANILLQKGKKEEAKKLLNDLSNTNSSYRERAIKKLAEMEF